MSERARLNFLSVLLLLALGIMILTVANALQAVNDFQHESNATKAGDVTTIRPWMTIHVISRVYHIPEDYLENSLQVAKKDPLHHATLYEIAAHKRQPLDRLIHTLQHTIFIVSQRAFRFLVVRATVALSHRYLACAGVRRDKRVNSFFITALHQYGYPALWAIIFIAAIGAPVSGNLLLYAAGAFAAFDDFNLFVLFAVAVSAAVMGDCVGYLLGWKLGNPLLVWLEKKKRWRFVSLNALARGRTYFRQRAAWAVFISRWLIVVLGGPINWFAGTERYPFRRFLIWDVSGQILGAIIPLGIGYIFAASWSEAESILGAFSSVALALLATLLVSMALVRKMRARKLVSALAETSLLQGEVVLSVSGDDAPTADEQDQADDRKVQREDAIAKVVNPTILILISRSGGGHLNLAQALQDELGESYNVLIMDPQSALVERGYTLVSRRLMKLLTWQYVLTDNKIAAWLLQNSLALLSRERFSPIDREDAAAADYYHARAGLLYRRARERAERQTGTVGFPAH